MIHLNQRPLTHSILNLFFAASVIGSQAALGATYTLKDLELLLDQKGYSEIIRHVSDIPPTQRTGRWLEIFHTAVVEQARSVKKTENCMSAFQFLLDLSQEYPVLNDQKKVTREMADMGVCAIETQNVYRANELADQIRKIDPGDETIYALATRTYEDKGFLELIERKKDAYKNDAKVHDYLFKRGLGRWGFDEPKGKIVKKLFNAYGLQNKPEYVKIIKENIEKELERSVGNASKMSLTTEDKNYIDLAREYRLLPAQKLQQIDLLQSKGVWPMLLAFKGAYAHNESLHQRMTYAWERLDPEDPDKKILKQLILHFKLCHKPKLAEELVNKKYYLEQIERSRTKFDEPFAYNRRNSDRDIANLDLAQTCGALSQSEVDEFYFLTYLYALPMGEYNKRNPLFFESVRRVEKWTPAQKAGWTKYAAARKLKNLFEGYRQLGSVEAIKYASMFPEIKAWVDRDCPTLLKSDSFDKNPELVVSDRESCEKLRS